MLLQLVDSSKEIEGIQLGTAFSDRINIGDNKLKPNKCLRKRKRQQIQDDDTSSSNTELTAHVIEVPLSYIRPPPLAFPKSAYSGSLPSLPRSTETSVLREILVGQSAFHERIRLANNSLIRLMKIGRGVPSLKMANLFPRPYWTIFPSIELTGSRKSTSGQWNLHRQTSSSLCMRSMNATLDISASMGG